MNNQEDANAGHYSTLTGLDSSEKWIVCILCQSSWSILMVLWLLRRNLFQFRSVTQSCPTLQPHGLQHARLLCPLLSPRICSIHVHWVGDASNHLTLCHSLLLLPSIFPSIRVFSNKLTLRTRRPKYWSFSFMISPSNGYSGLISFRIDWLDLPAVQGTLKFSPTPQFKSINSLAFSLPYGPTLTTKLENL